MKTKPKPVPPLQQQHWWALHDNVDGSIRKWFKSEIKAEPGTTLRCYQANNEKEALAQATEWAKEWGQRKRASDNARHATRTEKRKSMGLCVRCASPSDGSECQKCRDRRNLRKREIYHGGEKLKGAPIPDEKLKEFIADSVARTQARWGGRTAYMKSLHLKKLHALGASGYEEWLRSDIRAAGGGAALDEYERERAKQSDQAFRDAKRRYDDSHDEAAE